VPTRLVGGSLDVTTPFEANQEHPFEELPAGAKIVGLAELTDAGHFTFSDFCEVPRELLAFLGGFDEACEPRHLPWRRAHDIVKYLGLNFFDAPLNDEAAAFGRLDPPVVGAIEDLRVRREKVKDLRRRPGRRAARSNSARRPPPGRPRTADAPGGTPRPGCGAAAWRRWTS